MLYVERSRFISVPPTRVYEAFVDLDHWLEWNTHIQQVKLIGDGPLAVDSRTRVSVKGLPVPATNWRVTEIVPGRSFSWRSSVLPGVRVDFDHVAEPADGGTNVIFRIDIGGPLVFLAWPLGFLYSVNLARSLNRLKRMLEQEAPPQP